MATRAEEGREAERAYRVQLQTRAGPDYAGRMRTPPPLEWEAKRFGGGRHARGTSGLYDWFHELDPAEKQRIRENWMSPQGFKVDEMEDKLPTREWLSLTRRIDMSRAIAGGRHINRKRYGNLDPDKVLLSGAKIGQLRRRKGGGRRPGRGEGTSRPGCHFFTDDDKVVHPIRSTCEHARRESAAERQERYGADEPF